VTHTRALGRIHLEERSARRRYNTHNKQTSTPPSGFEPAIPASERPRAYALDRAGTGVGWN